MTYGQALIGYLVATGALTPEAGNAAIAGLPKDEELFGRPTPLAPRVGTICDTIGPLLVMLPQLLEMIQNCTPAQDERAKAIFRAALEGAKQFDEAQK